MSGVETYEDWWSEVDQNWSKLRRIFWRFLPTSGMEDFKGELMDHPLWMEIEELKEAGNEDLARYFHAAWSAAPDSPEIHQIPGWHILCDLCSEECVLYDPDPEDGRPSA